MYTINVFIYNASNEKTQGVGYGCGEFQGSVGMGILWGIPTGFSVGMGWIWGLKYNPHGSPLLYNVQPYES